MFFIFVPLYIFPTNLCSLIHFEIQLIKYSQKIRVETIEAKL